MLRRATRAWRDNCSFAASRPPSARRLALALQRAHCQAARGRRAAWTKYGARELGSEVAEWRSKASLLGPPNHERGALATTAFRQRARPCGQVPWSSRRLRITRTARNHCVLGKTSGRRAPSHVFCSVFVEDAKSSKNEVNEFIFPSDTVFHKPSACSSRLAQLAHVFPKNTWFGGVGAGRQRARLRRAGGSLD